MILVVALHTVYPRPPRLPVAGTLNFCIRSSAARNISSCSSCLAFANLSNLVTIAACLWPITPPSIMNSIKSLLQSVTITASFLVCESHNMRLSLILGRLVSPLPSLLQNCRSGDTSESTPHILWLGMEGRLYIQGLLLDQSRRSL